MYFGIAKDGFEGDQLSKEQLDLLVALGTDSNFAHGTDLAVRCANLKQWNMINFDIIHISLKNPVRNVTQLTGHFKITLKRACSRIDLIMSALSRYQT